MHCLVLSVLLNNVLEVHSLHLDNLKHYTFARTDDYLEELSEKIDAFNATERRTEREPKKGTSGYLKIIDFQKKQKNHESAKFKAL